MSMADQGDRELTLYLQSKKAVTSFYRPPASRSSSDSGLGVTDIRSTGRTEDEAAGSASEVFFLSDDQARCLALVEELARKRAYKVKVVDVSKAGRLEQLVTQHLRSVTTFPVLVGVSGNRLEGAEAFTEDHICEEMPTEMSTIRA